MPNTWIEVSPSGDGLHVWGTANYARGKVIQVSGGTVEMYGSGRYLTLTGTQWNYAPLELGDLTVVVAYFA